MFRNRTLVTFLLAGLLVAIVGALRPSGGDSGMPPQQFWARKISQKAQFDIVFAGDSRVLGGVSPDAMRDDLPGFRIANFGFSRCGLTPAYLTAAESMLDPAAPRPAIVLGVTPLSFTPKAARRNLFIEYQGKGTFEIGQQLYLGETLHFLRPYRWGWAFRSVGISRTAILDEYHPDGWIGMRWQPEDREWALRDARKFFADNPVSPDIETTFLRTVRTWTAKGIRVYAFRPPTPPATTALENELSQFNQTAFINRFRQAGGRWLPLPAKEYHSFDGSHLRADAALQLSRDLAAALDLPPLPQHLATRPK